MADVVISATMCYTIPIKSDRWEDGKMIYRDFKGTKLSMLGFGTMRLPVLENGQIDAALTQEMVDYAMAHGVNYYDTAWPTCRIVRKPWWDSA